MDIVLATSNEGKIREFQEYFREFDIEFGSLLEPLPEGVEDGDTFTSNALKKAIAASSQQNNAKYYLADDSGLSVNAMNGRPGIYSARFFYGGEGINKILSEMEGVTERSAYFTCALAIVDQKGQVIWEYESKWHGHIHIDSVGENGFGYDPIFVPEGYDLTAAQLEPSLKNSISHRGQAMLELKRFISENILTLS